MRPAWALRSVFVAFALIGLSTAVYIGAVTVLAAGGLSGLQGGLTTAAYATAASLGLLTAAASTAAAIRPTRSTMAASIASHGACLAAIMAGRLLRQAAAGAALEASGTLGLLGYAGVSAAALLAWQGRNDPLAWTAGTIAGIVLSAGALAAALETLPAPWRAAPLAWEALAVVLAAAWLRGGGTAGTMRTMLGLTIAAWTVSRGLALFHLNDPRQTIQAGGAMTVLGAGLLANTAAHLALGAAWLATLLPHTPDNGPDTATDGP